MRNLDQRGAVHCRRCFTAGSAVRPGDGIQTLRWWLNLSFSEALSQLSQELTPVYRVALPDQSTEDKQGQGLLIASQTQFARSAYQRMDPPTRGRLASELGVSIESLSQLRVGLTEDRGASTWPMRSATGAVIGVRIGTLPWSDGRRSKWSHPNGNTGIFQPRVERSIKQQKAGQAGHCQQPP